MTQGQAERWARWAGRQPWMTLAETTKAYITDDHAVRLCTGPYGDEHFYGLCWRAADVRKVVLALAPAKGRTP